MYDRTFIDDWQNIVGTHSFAIYATHISKDSLALGPDHAGEIDRHKGSMRKPH